MRPHHYNLTLKPNFKEFTFYGEETISLSIAKNTKTITLNSIEIEIEKAHFFQDGAEHEVVNISYDEHMELVIFEFPKHLKVGKGELKLKFKGTLNDKLRGFYRSKYFIEGKERYLATTQFEATDARRAFPCFDEPSLKATFDVNLLVPPDMVAISNTIENKVLEHDYGYKIFKFAPTPKMSTYLLAFIIGDFEYIEGKTEDGVKVRVFTTRGKKEQVKFALDFATKALSFYTKYFDIPYPLPGLDLIAIPDFSAGAMENWGAITFRESSILIDPKHSSAINKQRVATVISHEIAHMWFGNLVTMQWWTHLWLNEGFASYIEYLAVDHLFPQWDIWTQFVFLDQGVALSLDSLKNTHPIEVEIYHPSEISEIFDNVSYSKGASVIRMLAQYLGPKDFRDGLRHYLKKHSYANAVTQDLWNAFEEISKKPIKNMMKNWTSKPGYPFITVKEGKTDLKLSQTRFYASILSKKESRDKTTWNIPIEVLYQNSKTPQNFLMEEKTFSIPKPNKNTWVKLNADESSFIRVNYPEKYLLLLKNAIREGKLSPLNRLGTIRDAFSLSEAGFLPLSQALELDLGFKEELNYTVWQVLASQIQQVDNLIGAESFYPLYQLFCRSLFSKVAKHIGWEEAKNEIHTTTLLRNLALFNYGYFKDPDTVARAFKLFKEAVKNKGNVPPNIRTTVYLLVANYGTEDEYQTLIERYKATDSHQEKDRIGISLGYFKDRILLQKTLDFSLSSFVKSQDTVFIVREVAGNPLGRNLAWEFVENNWLEFKKRYCGGHFLLSNLINSFSVFTESQKADHIEKFFISNPVHEAARSIAQTLEKIRSNADWLSRDKRGIENYLKTLPKK